MNEQIITNAEAFKLLDLCSAVIVDDHIVTFPSLRSNEDEVMEDSIFLQLSYDLDCEAYDLNYAVKDNQNVKVINRNTIVLTDTVGGEVELTLLTTMNIPWLI